MCEEDAEQERAPRNRPGVGRIAEAEEDDERAHKRLDEQAERYLSARDLAEREILQHVRGCDRRGIGAEEQPEAETERRVGRAEERDGVQVHTSAGGHERGG